MMIDSKSDGQVVAEIRSRRAFSVHGEPGSQTYEDIGALLEIIGRLAGEPNEDAVKRALDAFTGKDFYAEHPLSVKYWEPRMRAALAAANSIQTKPELTLVECKVGEQG